MDRDMNLKARVSVMICLSLLYEAACVTEFEITVPSRTLTGCYAEALILPCTFPVDVSWDLSSTVITWQRGLEVVHSFYYSRDQLDRQNSFYARRTSLFHQQMAQGNASLRLDQTSLKDSGLYTCSVSTSSGSQKKSFPVSIAAFYSEPRLQVSVLNDEVNLIVTSEGGFPSPTLQWLIEDSEDITNQTHTHLVQDTHTGLYSVSSCINLTEGTNSSLIFILHNKPLRQNFRREIQLYSDKTGKQGVTVFRCHGCFTLIPGIGILLLIIMSLVFLFIRNRRTQTEKNTFTGHEFELETHAVNGKVDQPVTANILN